MITTVNDVTRAIEEFAPLYLQESYDNAGMQVGDLDAIVTGTLLCTDVTMPIIDEAIERGYNLIVSHHPLIFHGLKKIAGRTAIERIVAKAIKHGINIYAAHTNIDSARGGVSFRMAQKLGLTEVRTLAPRRGVLRKVAVYVPTAQAADVEKAMAQAGAGRLGDYDSCSYRLEGVGSYRALPGAHPFAGEVGEMHSEAETRVEMLVPAALCGGVIRAMLAAHPYEEPAFDVIPLDNADAYSGLGVVGNIEPEGAKDFLQQVKRVFNVAAIRYSGSLDRTVRRVALCGGAGSELVGDAIAQHADVYITGDVKYHEFQGHENSIVLADIGHYESEQFTKEIFCEVIKKKNPNFAVAFAQTEANQVKYL